MRQSKRQRLQLAAQQHAQACEYYAREAFTLNLRSLDMVERFRLETLRQLGRIHAMKAFELSAHMLRA